MGAEDEREDRMTGRSQQILSRFPTHLEAARPGKQLSVVTDALATDLDEQSAAMARIRRSHRLGEADELRDLLLVAALHGITPAELSLLFTRFDLAATLLSDLSKTSTDATRDEAAETLFELWSIALPSPLLPLFAPQPPPGNDPDLNAAKTRMVEHVHTAINRDALLDGVRKRIRTIARIHTTGNGTVRALLEGAANALDLDVIQIFHSADHFWHAASARDRLKLTRPVVEPAAGDALAHEVDTEFEPRDELMGIEENPVERAGADEVGRYHGERFSVLRRGFERAPLQVRITGKGTFTVGPMVVNRDEGHGVGYAASVPAGKSLVFTEEGRVLLDDTDVTSFGYAWKGACFAGTDRRSADSVFGGPDAPPERRARFAEATPAGALDPDFNFPHSGESLPMPDIEIGETRFAFFTQQAHFSKLVTNAEEHVLRVAPRHAVGFLDASVFAAAEDATPPVAAIVSLSWIEHRPFSVRVLIPRRFRAWTPDDPEGIDTKQRVAQALKRFRPAGVDVGVEFIDDRWALGVGTLVSGDSADLTDQLRGGTVLWSAQA